MREASTKPSAATVLPAPVACSNQKRLAAFGSSGCSRQLGVRRPRRRRVVPVLRLLGLVVVVGSSSPGMPTERQLDGVLAAPRRRRCRRRCAAPRRAARSACRTARRPGGRRAPCRRRAWARPRPAAARARAAATSWRRHSTDGTLAPASSSASAASSARAARGAGSERDGGVLALEHERLARELRGPLDGPSEVVDGRGRRRPLRGFSHRKADRGSGKATTARHAFAASWEACSAGLERRVGDRCDCTPSHRTAREAYSVSRAPGRSDVVSLPPEPMQRVPVHSAPSPSWRPRHRPDTGRRQRLSPRPARFDLAEAKQRARGRARAARAPCTTRPSRSSRAARARSTSASPTLKRPSGRDQQVGLVVRPVPRRVPDLPAGRHRAAARSVAFLGLNAATAPGGGALRRSTRCPTRPTRTRRDDRPGDRGARRTSRSRCSSTSDGKTASSTRAATVRAAELEPTSSDYLGPGPVPTRPSGPHVAVARVPDGAGRPADGPEGDRRRRARRPARRRASTCDAAAADRSRRATRSSRATRTRRRPRCTRCGRTAASRTRPAGRCASVPNLYPALDAATRPSPSADARPDLFAARAARARTR